MQFTGESLEDFRDWWMEYRPFAIPEDALVFQGDVHGIVLFRQAPFQVELFIMRPNSRVISHQHPNVDSFETHVSGGISFICAGARKNVPIGESTYGTFLRIEQDAWHKANFAESGGAFLSIQKWLNGVAPTSVTLDWVDRRSNADYAGSTKR